MDQRPELPSGLLPLPELGEGVVGTRVADGARWMLWAKAVAWLILAAFAVSLAAQSVGSPVGLLLGVGLALACGFMAAGSLALVSLGDRPALTVDADAVHCHVPLNRASVRLGAITRVERIRRDLLLDAPGGISRNGRPARSRWFAVTGAHTFDVARADLVEYLRARAVDARRP